MGTLHFLSTLERQINDTTIGYDGYCQGIHSRMLIWMGRPLFYPPTDEALNRWSHIALLNHQPCWIEDIGEGIPLRDLLPLSTDEAQFIFFHLNKAIAILHNASEHYGLLQIDSVYLRPNGFPLLVGIGRHVSSIEEDLQYLHTLAIQHRALDPNQDLNVLELTELPSSLQKKISEWKAPPSTKELVLEILEHPKKAELEQFDDDEPTQARGLMDVPEREDERTGAIYLQSEKSQRSKVYTEITKWLSTIQISEQSSKQYTSDQLQHLLLSFDPLSAPRSLSITEKTTSGWEATEHVEFSMSDTYAKTVSPQNTHFYRWLLLPILLGLFVGFFMGRC